jgi:hypothetical protein
MCVTKKCVVVVVVVDGDDYSPLNYRREGERERERERVAEFAGENRETGRLTKECERVDEAHILTDGGMIWIGWGSRDGDRVGR